MKIYFVDTSKPGIINFGNMGVRNFLISYYYERESGGGLIDTVRENFDNAKIFLDSGAYSAMTQNTTINLDEYIEFCRVNQDKVDLMANLDILGNGEASKESYDKMTDAGINVLPCYHLGEDYDLLKYYCKKADYVAIGGQVGLKFKLRELYNYFQNVFDIIPKEKKVHLFGVTNFKLMMRYMSRITSVDSSIVSRRSAYNNSLSYSGIPTNTKAIPTRINQEQVKALQEYAVTRILNIEKEINEMQELKIGQI